MSVIVISRNEVSCYIFSLRIFIYNLLQLIRETYCILLHNACGPVTIIAISHITRMINLSNTSTFHNIIKFIQSIDITIDTPKMCIANNSNLERLISGMGDNHILFLTSQFPKSYLIMYVSYTLFIKNPYSSIPL